MAKAKKINIDKSKGLGLVNHIQDYAKERNEAIRYLDNAKQILSEKAGKEGNFYTDKKYVRIAGHSAWSGVMIALDTIVPPVGRGKRKSIEHYQRNVTSIDKKLLRDMNILYENLHLVMGYDGNLTFSLSKDSLELAYQYIDKIFAKHK